MALQRKLISREEDSIKAEFLYDRQILSPNLEEIMRDKLDVGRDLEPMS